MSTHGQGGSEGRDDSRQTAASSATVPQGLSGPPWRCRSVNRTPQHEPVSSHRHRPPHAPSRERASFGLARICLLFAREHLATTRLRHVRCAALTQGRYHYQRLYLYPDVVWGLSVQARPKARVQVTRQARSRRETSLFQNPRQNAKVPNSQNFLPFR